MDIYVKLSIFSEEEKNNCSIKLLDSFADNVETSLS